MDDRERDVAALALRLSIGPMLIAHGANKVFGKGGLEGTTGWFESLGLKPAWVHARMAAATELGAGAMVTLGVADPLPSAAVVGLMMTAAATDHRGKGFFIFKGGAEYVLIVAAAATALAGLGSGRWSVQRLFRRRRRSGPGAAFVAVALGVASAAALLASSYRPEMDGGPDAAPVAAEVSADGDASAGERSVDGD